MITTFSIIDALLCLAGVYILYTAYLLKTKGEIKEGLLLPKDINVKKCKDKAGYIAEMFPKTVVFGSVVTVCGVMDLADDRYHFLGVWYYVVMVLFLGVTAWFAYETKKALKKYWP